MVALIVLTALVSGGVTLGVLQLQSPTNPQSVNLRPGVTITEDSAIVQAAAHARPAVVSVVITGHLLPPSCLSRCVVVLAGR